ncbi:hypothetical protein HOD96_03920 [Candidatus Falkowbacteria bacterium]|nr:hypothetical protein [Candidatus Falkowbacteria bacterium]MBT4433564.1 hypothetical protein [Candidatus Falkowbacteria bacterium]
MNKKLRSLIVLVISGIFAGIIGVVLMPEKKIGTIAIVTSAVVAQIIWDFVINPYLEKRMPKAAFIRPR